MSMYLHKNLEKKRRYQRKTGAKIFSLRLQKDNNV